VHTVAVSPLPAATPCRARRGVFTGPKAVVCPGGACQGRVPGISMRDGPCHGREQVAAGWIPARRGCASSRSMFPTGIRRSTRSKHILLTERRCCHPVTCLQGFCKAEQTANHMCGTDLDASVPAPLVHRGIIYQRVRVPVQDGLPVLLVHGESVHRRSSLPGADLWQIRRTRTQFQQPCCISTQVCTYLHRRNGR
jgi:hypothetical protein